MIGICYRYTADRQLSEDLAHEAFLKAIDKSSSFAGKGHFDAWLRRIVVNHVLQYFRDQKKSKNFEEWLQYESSMAQIEDNNFYTNVPEKAEFSEKELFDAINNLPNHHRLVFNLYVIDNFSHAQIGEKLGISPGTSKSHLARARKKIRQLLEEKTITRSGRKKGFLFLLLPYRLWKVDKLYSTQFNNFGLASKGLAIPNFAAIQSVPVIKPLAAVSLKIAAAASIGAVLTAGTIAYTINQKQDSSNAGRVAFIQPKDSGVAQSDTPVPAETDTTGATNFQNGVITKSAKNKNMKTLDSLGLMFLMSGIVSDTIAHPNYQKTSPLSTQAQVINFKNDPVTPGSLISSAASAFFKMFDSQSGTFTASSLFWSAENKVLYFKGAVKVNIGSNNFHGDGTFSFLGPVAYLVVDGKPVAPGSAVNLGKQKYKLVSLNSREAANKYGEKGRNGAVEISVAD